MTPFGREFGPLGTLTVCVFESKSGIWIETDDSPLGDKGWIKKDENCGFIFGKLFFRIELFLKDFIVHSRSIIFILLWNFIIKLKIMKNVNLTDFIFLEAQYQNS